MARAVGIVVIGKTTKSVANVNSELLIPEQSHAEFSDQFSTIGLYSCVRPTIGNTRFNDLVVTTPPSKGNIIMGNADVHGVTSQVQRSCRKTLFICAFCGEPSGISSVIGVGFSANMLYFEQTAVVFAANIPEPETYAMLLAGLVEM